MNAKGDRVWLQASMLADASDETLQFTRAIEAEDTEASALHHEIVFMLQKFNGLFRERACCLTVESYTKLMVDQLKGVQCFPVPATGIL